MSSPIPLRKVTDRTTIYFILMLGVVALLISLFIGVHQSIWFDEAYSIMVAKQTPGQIIHLVGLDIHPPFYYLVLHYWGQAFHWHATALRLLSACALGGSVIGAGVLVRRLFGNRAALFAALFAALSPLLLRYGFEIRMYMFASCIGIWATYVMVMARQAVGRRAVVLWTIYALLVATGMYTLYYLALLWCAHAVWLAWTTLRQKQGSRWRWLLAYGGSIVLFLPWLPIFFRQTGNGALATIGQPMNAENLLGVISFNTLYQPLWQLGVATSVLYIATLAAIIVLAVRGYRMLTKTEKSYLGLFIAYIGVPIAILVLISFIRSMYVERYLAHVAIGLMIVIGCLVAAALRRPTRGAWAAVALLVFACGVGVVHLAEIGNFNFQRMQYPAVDTAARMIRCNKDTAIVTAGPYVMIELAAYERPSCNMYFYSRANALKGGYAPLNGSKQQLTSTQIPAYTKTIYYVYYGWPMLKIPAGYSIVQSQVAGGLTVEVLGAH